MATTSMPLSSMAAAGNSSSSSDGGGGGRLDLVAALWIFGAPVIFTVGICGNALVLAVTSSPRAIVPFVTSSRPARDVIAARSCWP